LLLQNVQGSHFFLDTVSLITPKVTVEDDRASVKCDHQPAF